MDFDYVIAGGGSAGCTLAARLSEDPSKTVCLIEAGGEGRSLLVRAPGGIIAAAGQAKDQQLGLRDGGCRR
jgi:choline dehydrogenase-like flavoprotein